MRLGMSLYLLELILSLIKSRTEPFYLTWETSRCAFVWSACFLLQPLLLRWFSFLLYLMRLERPSVIIVPLPLLFVPLLHEPEFNTSLKKFSKLLWHLSGHLGFIFFLNQVWNLYETENNIYVTVILNNKTLFWNLRPHYLLNNKLHNCWHPIGMLCDVL